MFFALCVQCVSDGSNAIIIDKHRLEKVSALAAMLWRTQAIGEKGFSQQTARCLHSVFGTLVSTATSCGSVRMRRHASVWVRSNGRRVDGDKAEGTRESDNAWVCAMCVCVRHDVRYRKIKFRRCSLSLCDGGTSQYSIQLACIRSYASQFCDDFNFRFLLLLFCFDKLFLDIFVLLLLSFRFIYSSCVESDFQLCTFLRCFFIIFHTSNGDGLCKNREPSKNQRNN